MVAISAAKLTLAEETPSSPPTFFSIRAEQLLQLIPLTAKVIVLFFSEIMSSIVYRAQLFLRIRVHLFHKISPVKFS